LKGILIDTLPDLEPNYILLELKTNYSVRLNIQKMKREVKESSSFLKRHYSTDNFILKELQILNALSSEFSIQYFDKNKELLLQQNFEKGEIKKRKNKIQILNSDTIDITFNLDEEIWKNLELNKDFIVNTIRDFAYLYKQVKFEIRYKLENEECKIIYHFKNGLKDKLDFAKIERGIKSIFETLFEEKFNDFSVEVAFTLNQYSNEPYIKSFVNNMETKHHGTHVNGIIKGLKLGIKKYLKQHDIEEYHKVSKKILENNLMLVLNIKLDFPILENAMKSRLSNKEIIKPLSNYVSTLFFDRLEKDESFAKKIIDKFRKKE